MLSRRFKRKLLINKLMLWKRWRVEEFKSIYKTANNFYGRVHITLLKLNVKWTGKKFEKSKYPQTRYFIIELFIIIIVVIIIIFNV